MTPSGASGDPHIGRVVADKYRIEAVVGSGGSGTVYRATHLGLDRPIALKVLNPSLVANPNTKARFRREARAASRLDHPNSVQVLDYGIEPDGLTYLAMELLEGRELFKVIYDDWPMPTERIVAVMTQVLSVLAAAHDAGIVHRDLKPENIMLLKRTGDDGLPTEVAKVADFGIAKTFTGPVSDDSLKLTRDGTVHGTPEYMSPEQARGEEVDGRSDLYACGVILYEMVVGALPFTGESTFDVILKQLSDPVPPPSSRRGGIDLRLEPVILRALAKDRNARYPDARAMRAALLEAVGRAATGPHSGRSTPLVGSGAPRAHAPAPPDVTQPSPLVRRSSLASAAIPLTQRRPDEGDVPAPPPATPGDAPGADPRPRAPSPTASSSSSSSRPPAVTLDEPPPELPIHRAPRWLVAAVVVVVLLVAAGVAWNLLGASR